MLNSNFNNKNKSSVFFEWKLAIRSPLRTCAQFLKPTSRSKISTNKTKMLFTTTNPSAYQCRSKKSRVLFLTSKQLNLVTAIRLHPRRFRTIRLKLRTNRNKKRKFFPGNRFNLVKSSKMQIKIRTVLTSSIQKPLSSTVELSL